MSESSDDRFEEFLADVYQDRILLMAGTWRRQKAYRVVRYRVGWSRDGFVWKSTETMRGMSSMPQLERAGYGDLAHGSLHDHPVDTAAIEAALAGFEDRPDSTIPEDYYV